MEFVKTDTYMHTHVGHHGCVYVPRILGRMRSETEFKDGVVYVRFIPEAGERKNYIYCAWKYVKRTRHLWEKLSIKFTMYLQEDETWVGCFNADGSSSCDELPSETE